MTYCSTLRVEKMMPEIAKEKKTKEDVIDAFKVRPQRKNSTNSSRK